jgi:hypothetical protein
MIGDFPSVFCRRNSLSARKIRLDESSILAVVSNVPRPMVSEPFTSSSGRHIARKTRQTSVEPPSRAFLGYEGLPRAGTPTNGQSLYTTA